MSNQMADNLQGGDAVRLAASWPWGEAGGSLKVGDIGVIDGPTAQDILGGSITFNATTHREDGGVTSCSGGPATIWTPAYELRPTGETHELRVWRWKDGHPGQGRGVDYLAEVPLWDWFPNSRVNGGDATSDNPS